MKIKISNCIELYPKNEEEKRIIRSLLAKDLVFPDPKQQGATFMMKSAPPIVCYSYNKKGNYFIIPKGRISILNKLSYVPQIEFESLTDNRTEGESIQLKCNFGFRDKIQEDAFNAYISNPSKIGIINLSCGLGDF